MLKKKKDRERGIEESHMCQVPNRSLSIEQLTHVLFSVVYKVGDVTEN